MEGGRRVTTVRQLQLLVEFAESNRDLALGRLRSKEARALSTRLWRECAETLNSEGPARLPKEWAKIWNDMKSRVRSKLTANILSQRGTGGGPHTSVTLSSLEERVADIIGQDIGPIANVAQNQFMEQAPDENSVVIDFLGDQQHEANEEAYDLILTDDAGPSSINIPPPLESQLPPSPLLPRSRTTTPRRRRQRGLTRQRPVATQGQTSRSALEESRKMMLRIEELRARTHLMLAESALKQADAAKAQAEASIINAEARRLQAQAMATFCHSVSTLVPAVHHLIASHASPVAQVVSNRRRSL